MNKEYMMCINLIENNDESGYFLSIDKLEEIS
jgi:hypothetical protein